MSRFARYRRIAAFLLVGLALPTDANAAIEALVLEGGDRVQVLFEHPVLVDSMKHSTIVCYGVIGAPSPELIHLRPVSVAPIEPGAIDDLFMIEFADSDGAPAFSNAKAQYTLVIEGVKKPDGKKLGKQSVTFGRFPKPALGLDSRRVVEVFDAANPGQNLLSGDFERRLLEANQGLAVGDEVSLALSRDGVDYSRSIPVETVELDRPNLRLFLGKPLPKGSKFYAKVGLPGKEEGSTVSVKGTGTLAAPKGRSDKTLQYFVDLAFISDGTGESERSGDRDEEGTLDLLVRPSFPFWHSGGSPWVRRWQPVLDAKVGTDRAGESKAANTVSAGFDLLFDRPLPSAAEHRIRAGLRHNSDKDFKARELAVDARWQPVAKNWIKGRDLRVADFRLREGNARKTPRVRSWSFVPFVGVEYGEVLEAPPTMEAGGVKDGDTFTRWKAGFDLDLEIDPFTLSVSDTFRKLDEGEDKSKNILEVAFTYQLTSVQGIGLKYQKGYDVPKFEEVDTLSLSYRFKY